MKGIMTLVSMVLMLLAVFVFVGIMSGMNMWGWIAAYWLLVSFKYALEVNT